MTVLAGLCIPFAWTEVGICTKLLPFREKGLY